MLVCDTGAPRNASTHESHGFFSRDGADPAELLRDARRQLDRYEGVELRQAGVEVARRDGDRFELRLGDGTGETARRVLLATGVVDELPPIQGLGGLWGRSVFNCPYCDGWEVRDQPLAVLGGGEANLHLAVTLTRWSRDVVWCTNGPAELPDQARGLLDRLGVRVRQEPIARLEASDGRLERVVFADGAVLPRRAGFLRPPVRQHSELARQLGCSLLEDGCVEVNDLRQTGVAGVSAAGDMARRPSMPVAGAQIVLAAAEGVVAAVAIDQELILEELGLPPSVLQPGR